MASYTMTLKECLETLLVFDRVDVSVLTTKQMIEEGRKRLFDFEYTLFDPLYKGVFETNFIRNFYMREIGFETEGLFKFQLESWLLIHMPYYNKMFESELLTFDPLVNSEMNSNYTKTKDTDGTVGSTQNGNSTKTNNQTVNGTENQISNGTQNGTSFNRDLENDTPDNRLAITTADGAGVIEYASKINENTGKDSSTTTNDVDTTTTNTVDGTNTDVTSLTGNTTTDMTEAETYVQSRTGKIGAVTYSKMLMEYRESLVRINKQIFDEMQQLFMLVYS